MKNLYFLPIFIMSLFSSAFCFSDVPKWITNLNGEFSSENYIRAVGEGSSETLAKKSAVAELSAYFGEAIESKIYAHSNKIQKDSEYSSNSSILQDITTSTNSELFFVHYTDVYYDKKEKKYSVCAYINKRKAFDIISQKILSYERNFTQKLEFLQNENEDFIKIIILNDALYDEDEIKRLYDFLRGLGYQKSEKIDDFIASRNEANNLLDELKRKNPLSIISTGDYSEQIKSIISEILTNSGFLLSKNAEYKIVSTSYLDIIKYNNIFSCTPTISVVIESNGETISSCFLSAENFSSYNKQTLIRKSLFNVEVLLHEKFIRSLLK